MDYAGFESRAANVKMLFSLASRKLGRPSATATRLLRQLRWAAAEAEVWQGLFRWGALHMPQSLNRDFYFKKMVDLAREASRLYDEMAPWLDRGRPACLRN